MLESEGRSQVFDKEQLYSRLQNSFLSTATLSKLDLTLNNFQLDSVYEMHESQHNLLKNMAVICINALLVFAGIVINSKY